MGHGPEAAASPRCCRRTRSRVWVSCLPRCRRTEPAVLGAGFAGCRDTSPTRRVGCRDPAALELGFGNVPSLWLQQAPQAETRYWAVAPTLVPTNTPGASGQLPAHARPPRQSSLMTFGGSLADGCIFPGGQAALRSWVRIIAASPEMQPPLKQNVASVSLAAAVRCCAGGCCGALGFQQSWSREAESNYPRLDGSQDLGITMPSSCKEKKKPPWDLAATKRSTSLQAHASTRHGPCQHSAQGGAGAEQCPPGTWPQRAGLRVSSHGENGLGVHPGRWPAN